MRASGLYVHAAEYFFSLFFRAETVVFFDRAYTKCESESCIGNFANLLFKSGDKILGNFSRSFLRDIG